jgi:uncharacterized protein YecT (DUF1311 family)
MIALVTALLLSAQDPQWNCDNPQAQQEMNYCAAQDAERADAELNAAYRAEIEHAREADREYARLTEGRSDGDPTEEATLREAQRAWVTFRTAHCRLESYEARGGSMQPMIDGGCRATLTRARTAELRGPDPDCPGGADQPTLNACMTARLTRDDEAMNRQWRETLAAREQGGPAGVARLRAAQRAWLAFRDAHCDSVYRAEIGASLDATMNIACRADLTEARTRELADIAAMAE